MTVCHTVSVQSVARHRVLKSLHQRCLGRPRTWQASRHDCWVLESQGVIGTVVVAPAVYPGGCLLLLRLLLLRSRPVAHIRACKGLQTRRWGLDHRRVQCVASDSGRAIALRVGLHLLVVLCHARAWGRLHVVHAKLGHVPLKHVSVLLVACIPHSIRSGDLSVE